MLAQIPKEKLKKVFHLLDEKLRFHKHHLQSGNVINGDRHHF